jgi:hypothetical protein
MASAIVGSREGTSRMNWAWLAPLEHIWRSPEFPMWATLAAAGFFALILLITLLRAEKSVANGALTVITLLAVGVAVTATIRGYGPLARTTTASVDRHPAVMATTPASPALACVEDIAGDAVAAACEKAVFASADSTAAAVNHMAQMITRLTSYGDAATAQKTMTPELQGLRRAIERDRYGLVAQVLLARDRCTPTQCPAFRSLTDNHQIITNMDEHAYDVLVSRYATVWNAPPPPATGPVAMLPPSPPTGRPTNADFPSAASTPPISIMTAEPGAGPARTGTAAGAPKAAVPPPAAAEAKPPAAPKKQAAKKPAAPTSIAPAAAPAAGSSGDDQ